MFAIYSWNWFRLPVVVYSMASVQYNPCVSDRSGEYVCWGETSISTGAVSSGGWTYTCCRMKPLYSLGSTAQIFFCSSNWYVRYLPLVLWYLPFGIHRDPWAKVTKAQILQCYWWRVSISKPHREKIRMEPTGHWEGCNCMSFNPSFWITFHFLSPSPHTLYLLLPFFHMVGCTETGLGLGKQWRTALGNLHGLHGLNKITL